MKIIGKTLIISAFIAAAVLSVYTFKLKQDIAGNERMINELKSKLSDNKIIAGKYVDQADKCNHLLTKLKNEYISQRQFDEGPEFLEYKRTIVSLIDERISEIVGDNPAHGGSWVVSKVEFLNPVFIYVEYEDGHNTDSTFIQIVKSENGYVFAELF